MNIDIEVLSMEEKIQLVERLWDDIEKERAAPLSPAQQQLLEERLAIHAKNPSAGKSWQDVKAKYFK
jgi:putative addiction module component (TIGR02574 family)